MRPRVRDDAGDTLVEVLVTLVVVGLAVISMVGAYTTSIHAAADYRNVSTLNTVITDASQNAISEIQQLSNFKPCATPADYSTLSFGAPSGYTVAVTNVSYLSGGSFVSTCTAGSTAPQDITAVATQTSTGATATINFVVDDRGGTAGVTMAASVITTTSTPPTNPLVGGTYAPTATATSGDPVVITIDAVSTGVCSYSTTTGRVTFSTAGTCTVDFNDPGNATYTAAAQVQQTMTVTRATSVITVTSSAPSPAFIGGTYAPTATATSGDPVVITVDSTSTGVCSYSTTTGRVTFSTAGTCTLDFNDAGNATYAAATQVQQSISIKRANVITVTTSMPTHPTIGGTYTPLATATSGDPVVITVDSTSTGVCSYSTFTGRVTFSTAGTCTLDFNDAGNATYVAATQVQQSATVLHSNTITVNTTSVNNFVGGTYFPSATATSGDPVAISVDPASTTYCSLSGGKVTYLARGTCTLDFNDPGNATYVAATQVQQSITVLRANVITVNTTPPTQPLPGGTYRPSATATSGDPVAISVDPASNGVCSYSTRFAQVTFQTAGTCTLDFNDAGSAFFAAAPQVQQSFNILQSNTITVTFTPVNTYVGGTDTPTATASSNDTVVITVDPASFGQCTYSNVTGLVTYLARGTCTLDFNDPGNAFFAAAPQVQLNISVKGVNVITITSASPGFARVGNNYTPSATATSGDPVAITVDPASSAVCTAFSFRGVVRVFFNAAGTCTIDFNDPGNANYGPAPQQQQSFTVR